MKLSRRGFIETAAWGTVGAMTGAVVSGRGREALAGLGRAGLEARLSAATPSGILLNSNENPNGPGRAVLDALSASFGRTSRYPFEPTIELADAIARHHGVARNQVTLGCGSSEVLKMAVEAFTGPGRALVTALPTFEDPARLAEARGAEVRAVRVDSQLQLDLEGMASRAAGAGLVFLCNPNNPTATAHPAGAVRDFVARIGRTSPQTTILIDEAYYEYVDDPAFATALPLAKENPRVIVSRTFSKAYGLAGLRAGYGIAQAATIEALERHKLGLSVNTFAIVAALRTLPDERHLAGERARNREAREYARQALQEAGYPSGPSHTNFILVDVRRDSREVQAACRDRGVHIGRPFPPLTTHARISIGTMEEMRRAMPILKAVLAPASSAAR